MEKAIIDYSNLSADGRRYMEVALSHNVYILSIKNDGAAVILDLQGMPVHFQTGQGLVENLAKRYPPYWYVYIAKRKTMNKYKIGVSCNPRKRALSLGLELVHIIHCADKTYALETEMRLHTSLKIMKRQIHGEWFHLNDDDLDKLLKCDWDEDVAEMCERGVKDYLSPYSKIEDEHSENRKIYLRLMRKKD